MITKIAIENFKGIRERVEVEIRPITLLFGANSAGKSSILHALHYAGEIFENHNLDPDRTVSGGSFVDLGGFGNLVHGHDRSRDVSLSFDLDLRGTKLPDYTNPYYGPHDSLLGNDPPSLTGDVHSARIEVTVAWSELRCAAYVKKYTVAINGNWLATISCEPGQPTTTMAFKPDHPVFLPASEFAGWIRDEYLEFPVSGLQVYWAMAKRSGVIHELRSGEVEVTRQKDALPRWSKRLSLNWDFHEGLKAAESYAQSYAEALNLKADVGAGLSRVIVGPGQVLRGWLQEFRYLGPLRETPPRSYSPPRRPDPARWASGLGAWDRLHAGDETLVQAVSDWLSEDNRLNTGYRLQWRKFKELDLDNPLLSQLLTDQAFDQFEKSRTELERMPTLARLVISPQDEGLDLRPHDVGVGISQVLPVVVTALDGDSSLCAIEQPELHVHPRLQANMGDLFIQAAMENKKAILLETHSEHLILRLQRRIRETTKGEPHAGIPLTGSDVAVYYVSQEDGMTRLTKIDLDRKGEFVQPWPDDFFEVDFHERFH